MSDISPRRLSLASLTTSAKARPSQPSNPETRDHPCYSAEAHHHFARLHLAVAPGCNIQCNYCNRKYDCANESRPGVVSERLTPEQGLRKAVAVANRVPELSVLGIAGPGDALHDWRRTFRTLELIRQELPHLTLCLATNGLSLPDHVDGLIELGVKHVTITINAIDPEVGAAIHPWVAFGGRRHSGRAGAEILIERQLAGLDALVAQGALVKVNSVLVPGINDQHLSAVNAEVRGRGAFLHNVMPLISDPAHGTHFGLTGQRGPTNAELAEVRDRLGEDARLMRHCRQCRADAVGRLGEDRGAEFALDSLPETPETFDPSPAEAYRAVVAEERAEQSAAAADADRQVAKVAALADGVPRTVAVCTRGGGRVNQHFGHAREFHIYRVDGDGVRFKGLTRADNYCLGGSGDGDAWPGILGALQGVDVVLCGRIGERPRAVLAENGIAADDSRAYHHIEAAITAWYVEQAEALSSQAVRPA
ncbi:nitrogenase cofactor biosynthesis protein NifB [Roseospirillum parvum]|uniref:FeMo cofactor biosynthesis protein NifB n=1 Tax=Roseospirillum parvum TaxID=83401 RepID=A0A1G7XXW0_9PROT|nr:nitrogenase cofactor biosynthesis protein NifB [Roseospirillum parvum]SDG88866.1 nitrogen fixation protein NifB [Roseospirillum parvum]